MKKILVLFQVVLLGSCSNGPDTFGTFDVDPIKTALKNENIRDYEEFIVISDSIIKTNSYQVDGDGNILTKDAFPGVFGSHDKFEYDSLGRLTSAVYVSDVVVEYTVDYELIPKAQTVKQFWRRSDGLWRTRTLKYNYDLDKILAEVETRNLDTVKNLSFAYDKDKISKVFDSGQMSVEFTYDVNGKLKAIKRFYASGYYEIDHVSRMTGLIDSTTRHEDGRKYVIYYRYNK